MNLSTITNLHNTLTEYLNHAGTWLSPLGLRVLLAWEYGEAGFEKLHGNNWFADISFPFPFNLLPASFSWGLATGFEIVGAFALLFGLATRFFSASLIILTIVAIAAVHWPADWNTLSELWQGYRILDSEGDGRGNYKLPLLFIVMLLPLVFNGAGKLSLDHLTHRWIARK